MTVTGKFFDALGDLDTEQTAEHEAAGTAPEMAGTAAQSDDTGTEVADAATEADPTAPEVADTAPDVEAVEVEATEVAAVQGEAGTSAVEDAPPAIPTAVLRAAVEAVLMVIDAPVTEIELATACRCTAMEISAVLHELAEEYRADGRGFTLRESGGGWRFWSDPQYADVVERFVRDGQQAKLTQAALETLAVVAYRQPVTRSRVAAVRGVNVDGVMRTLLTRGLVEEAGTEEGSGATFYRTTSYFLDRLGIDSLDELPELAPFLPAMDALDDVEMPGI